LQEGAVAWIFFDVAQQCILLSDVIDCTGCADAKTPNFARFSFKALFEIGARRQIRLQNVDGCGAIQSYSTRAMTLHPFRRL